MYKNLALINGVLLAIMIFFNGMLSSITGPYLSTLLFHVLGLFIILVLSLIRKNRLFILNIPILFFLPGLLSVITILLNNLCIPQIGITLTIGISLYGQLVMSSVIEHFGLYGMPMNRFKKEKILGMSIISLGIIVMIFV
jgi:transporter family-2 protein